MQTETIMSKPAVMCSVHDNLSVAAHLMWEHDCGAIPVVDDEGRLVGVVTDRDICMATYTQGQSPLAIGVAVAMAKQVWSCAPGDSIEAAEQLMRDKQIRRIPVVDDDGHPIGLLSLNDITRHACAAKKRNGADRAVADTLAAICQPRLRDDAPAVLDPGTAGASQ